VPRGEKMLDAREHVTRRTLRKLARQQSGAMFRRASASFRQALPRKFAIKPHPSARKTHSEAAPKPAGHSGVTRLVTLERGRQPSRPSFRF
jgi:hypothetical protein